ncbi:MAG TPA: LysR family transcriptional regulator [Actinomycetota bacterium]|jgi:DNA-binding transcriptional LysR family regulator|nr:LysR family transcriptional regulator [Actinomycetota bacterium]
MDLRRLRLLDEFARRGRIAAVAEALAYSPSSVSVQLAELEREAGTKLLRRVGRNLELTPAGWRLAEHAAEALAADEAVLSELTSLSDAPRGRVRMTFVQTPALALLPLALEQLNAAAPNLQVEVVQMETAPAVEALRSRAVDLVVGIEYEPVPVSRHRDIDRRDLLRESVLLTVHPKHPGAAGAATISLSDVEHTPWAAGHRGTGLSAVIENVCNRLGGYAPDIRHRSDDGLILSALVASGRAVTLLPALLARTMPHVVARPIREGPLQRTIFTAARAVSADAPAVTAVRDALGTAAAVAATDRDDVEVLPAGEHG